MKPRIWFAMLALFIMASVAAAQDMPLFRWENFTTANGLPDNHVFCVLVDGNRIWAGTENGLGLYENGAWKVFRPTRIENRAWRIRPCCPSLSISAPAMCGPAPWAA